MMNDLYANEYSLLVNFFLPSVKLQEKKRVGSKIIKRHDKPTTPCDRLLASRYISREKKLLLKEQRTSLNPFLLQSIVHQKLKRILRQCSLRPIHPDLRSSLRLAPNKQSKELLTNQSKKDQRKTRSGAYHARHNVTQN